MGLRLSINPPNSCLTRLMTFKADLTRLKTLSSSHDKKTVDLEVKVNEMERYRRRCNLRLYGLDEHEGRGHLHCSSSR